MSALQRLWAPMVPDNAWRDAPVESYFLRANCPTRPLALWVKATTLRPVGAPPVAETWFIFFDGERGRSFAQRHTQPLDEAVFAPPCITTRWLALRLEPEGGARGEVEAPEGRVGFDLHWRVGDGLVAAPLSLLPAPLLRAPLPRSKLLTPYPSLRLDGLVSLPGGEQVDLAGWHGMQGHNWGAEHAFDYAWGQCLFPEDDAMVEGFSARVRVGGALTPRSSMLVVRRGGRTWRFGQRLDVWRQQASLDGTSWGARLVGDDGEVSLRMTAAGRPMVCLGYRNPDGALSYCLNSKLAEVELTVRPADAASFTCRSAHGGALEFLQRAADPRFDRVV